MINKNTQNMNESMFSQIDLIRQDSKDVRDFVKRVFSDKEFKSMSKDTDFLKYLKSIYEGTVLDEEHVRFSNRTSNGSIATGSVHTTTTNEAILKGRDYQYDKKQGVVRISKKNFSKVHKDGKLVKNGKPFMMVLTDKGTSLVPAQFESSVNEDGTPCWDTHKVGNPKTKVSSKTGKRVNNCVPKGESVTVNEASKLSMGIAGFTGLRGDAIDKFIDTYRIDATKLFNFVKKGKLSDRRDVMTAIAGKPNNVIQKKIVKLFGESVNESWTDWKQQGNLNTIIALSKKNKNKTFLVTDDNHSRIGTFWLKNGKFAKQTVANPSYDFQSNKTTLRSKSDVIYKYKMDESVVSEGTPFHVLFKVKKDVTNRSIKPATASYKSESDAKKFLQSVKKDGGKGMIVRRNEVSEDKNQITQLKKKVGNSETKFYDALSKVEKKIGKKKYRLFIEFALKENGVNPKHYDYRTNAAVEEKLFQIS